MPGVLPICLAAPPRMLSAAAAALGSVAVTAAVVGVGDTLVVVDIVCRYSWSYSGVSERRVTPPVYISGSNNLNR